MSICEGTTMPKRRNFIARILLLNGISELSAAIKGLFQGKTNIIWWRKRLLNCKNVLARSGARNMDKDTDNFLSR
jgi:hypothetical protein